MKELICMNSCMKERAHVCKSGRDKSHNPTGTRCVNIYRWNAWLLWYRMFLFVKLFDLLTITRDYFAAMLTQIKSFLEILLESYGRLKRIFIDNDIWQHRLGINFRPSSIPNFWTIGAHLFLSDENSLQYFQ